jgi:ABC-type multidrug transport system fused ATPase/permease subunit
MLKIIKTFYRFLLKKRLTSLLFFTLIIVAPLVESILPYFYKLFVDAIGKLDYPSLLKLLITYVGLYLLSRGLDALAYFVGDILLIDALIDSRTAIFKRIHDLDFAFHTQKSSGALISVFKRGQAAFWDLQFSIHFRIIRVIVSFSVMAYFFAHLDWRVFSLTILSFLLSLVVTRGFIKMNIRDRVRFNREEDKITGIIVDNMVNFETVKLFAKENWERKRLSGKFIGWKKALWQYAISYRYLDVAMMVVAIGGIFFTLLVTLQATVKGQFSPGDFVLVVGFTAAFYPRLFDLIWGLRQIAKNYSDIQKYFGILDQEIKVRDPKKPIKPPDVKGEIEYRRVSFAYEENEKDAVKKVDLKIRAGQSIALVGRSGAGKTTMVKLLMRFFDVQKGAITIDRINLKKWRKSDLRNLMGVVPQEPVLFNHTIGYNIAYAKPGAPVREIEAAAKMAHIHRFIKGLPRGYRTQVGERGIKLSGGQKQRVAIARMILSNPKIIIFDEATSQLDSESERLIQDAFWKATHNKSTIIIAHRLSTVKRADKIVVMEKGKIVETGSHHALVKKKDSLYHHFWKLQALE